MGNRFMRKWRFEGENIHHTNRRCVAGATDGREEIADDGGFPLCAECARLRRESEGDAGPLFEQ